MNDVLLSVRSLQLMLGVAYAIVAAAAAARAGSVPLAAAAIALGIGAYLTGRRTPSGALPLSQVWRAIGLGMIVLVVGCVAVAVGAERGLEWAGVVAGFCAGNRIKAGMPSRR